MVKEKGTMVPQNEDEADTDEETEGGAGRQFISALARGLDVLAAFREDDPPLSNQELAKRTGFPRPTISRITHTLTELGYLSYNERYGCYELGGGALVLGHVARANFNVMDRIKPVMQRLANVSNVNVGLGARDRLSMTYLEVVHGPSRIGLRFEIGSRVPILNTAMGRAYLAAAPADKVASLVKQLKAKYKHDPEEPHRIVEMARSEYKRLGFCTSIGDWHDDIHGISVPVNIPELGGLLAINCGAPAYLAPKTKMLNEIGPQLVEAVGQISSLFGRLHSANDTHAGAGLTPPTRAGGEPARTRKAGSRTK